jgi:hypothetical protein
MSSVTTGSGTGPLLAAVRASSDVESSCSSSCRRRTGGGEETTAAPSRPSGEMSATLWASRSFSSSVLFPPLQAPWAMRKNEENNYVFFVSQIKSIRSMHLGPMIQLHLNSMKINRQHFGSGFNRVSGSGLGIRIRIRSASMKAKIVPKNRIFFFKFHV